MQKSGMQIGRIGAGIFTCTVKVSFVIFKFKSYLLFLYPLTQELSLMEYLKFTDSLTYLFIDELQKVQAQ